MNTNKEVIMKDEKVKATASADEKLRDALVLRPEWEVKPKSTETENNFTVSFSEKTRVLLLTVNGDYYKKILLDDATEGKVKFHEALSHVINKFELWGIRAKN